LIKEVWPYIVIICQKAAVFLEWVPPITHKIELLGGDGKKKFLALGADFIPPKLHPMVTPLDCDLRRRFESILQPAAQDFNPLPAVACLLEPSFSSVMMQPEQAALLHAAKTYIIQECTALTPDPDPVPSSSDDANKTSAPALKRFRFLSSKLMAQEPSATHSADTAATQIANSQDIWRKLLRLMMSMNLTSGQAERLPTASGVFRGGGASRRWPPPLSRHRKFVCRTGSSGKSKETGFGESGGHGRRHQSAST
jgi:hypothetical protein